MHWPPRNHDYCHTPPLQHLMPYNHDQRSYVIYIVYLLKEFLDVDIIKTHKTYDI
jgi:hypothetical protein